MEEKVQEPSITASVPEKVFGGLEEEYSSLKKSKAVIIPVPFDKTTSYIHGTNTGPAAIIAASQELERFDDELNQETYKIGIHTMPALPVENMSSEEMVEKVYSSTLETAKSNKFPVILGGEHSVSIGSVKALKEVYPDLSVLHLDAHLDLRNEYRGSKYNHACAARRMSEHCPIVEVGIRNVSKEEKDFLATQANGKVKVYTVYDILEEPMWKSRATNDLSEHVYVSIDLDVFDPAMVPSVGTPEPGGLGWYECLSLLKETAKDKKIVGFDIVELCPIKGDVSSDFFAAKLLYRLLGYVFTGKK